MDGITYRTTDMLRWGAGGGAGTDGRLTNLQIDENWWELYSRLKNLEDNPPEAVGIQGFTVLGSQFRVNMTDGSNFGPYTLPIATFRLLGEWVNDFPYKRLDFFTVEHRGLYMVLIDHTSPASPAEFDDTAIDEDSGSPTFGLPLYQLVFGEDAYIYDVGFFYPGKPGLGIEADQAIFGHQFVRRVRFPAGLPTSVAAVRVAYAAGASWTIKKNDVEVGTVDFATAATEGTFDFTGDVDFEVGDVLTVCRTGSVDATARELKITFRGERQDF